MSRSWKEYVQTQSLKNVTSWEFIGTFTCMFFYFFCFATIGFRQTRVWQLMYYTIRCLLHSHMTPLNEMNAITKLNVYHFPIRFGFVSRIDMYFFSMTMLLPAFMFVSYFDFLPLPITCCTIVWCVRWERQFIFGIARSQYGKPYVRKFHCISFDYKRNATFFMLHLVHRTIHRIICPISRFLCVKVNRYLFWCV